MTRIVINTVCTGLGELSPFTDALDVLRHDPKLVALVAIVQATTNCFLSITEIPDGAQYIIIGDPERCLIKGDVAWIETTSREQAERTAKVRFDRIIDNMEAVAEINLPWSEGPIDTPSVVTDEDIMRDALDKILTNSGHSHTSREIARHALDRTK